MVAYVIDTPRCTQPQVFMSNMLQVMLHITRSHCRLPFSTACLQSLCHSKPTLALPPQACSILYKTRLPLLLVFNKTDIARHDFAVEWMQVGTTSLVTCAPTAQVTHLVGCHLELVLFSSAGL